MNNLICAIGKDLLTITIPGLFLVSCSLGDKKWNKEPVYSVLKKELAITDSIYITGKQFDIYKDSFLSLPDPGLKAVVTTVNKDVSFFYFYNSMPDSLYQKIVNASFKQGQFSPRFIISWPYYDAMNEKQMVIVSGEDKTDSLEQMLYDKIAAQFKLKKPEVSFKLNEVKNVSKTPPPPPPPIRTITNNQNPANTKKKK